MTISVIGLGKIGSAIVPHLVQLGEEVKVWNRSSAAVARSVACGAVPAIDLVDAVSADVVFSALFDDDAIRDVITPTLLSHLSGRPILHVCLSTLSPDLADELSRWHEAIGVGYLAAPLFGRPEAVRERAAQICVAGRTKSIEKARPYLESFGRVWHIGEEPRQANIAKLCGNFLIGAAIGAMAEAASILSAENADAHAFMTLMTETLFFSPVHRNYAQSVTGARPLPASGLKLPIKDMALLSKIAGAGGASASFLKTLQEALLRADESGLGNEDWSVALGILARGGPAHSSNEFAETK
jgi:3-hydroxyisobutyrate dehydrogenase-like beta-hydroxyacid dehydrogenase